MKIIYAMKFNHAANTGLDPTSFLMPNSFLSTIPTTYGMQISWSLR